MWSDAAELHFDSVYYFAVCYPNDTPPRGQSKRSPWKRCRGDELRARCNGSANRSVHSIQKTTFRQLGSTKIPAKKTALCCLLFHEFPSSLPICGSDWLHAVCQCTQRAIREPEHKNTTLLCGERRARHARVLVSHRRPTLSLRPHGLRAGEQVNAMSGHVTPRLQFTFKILSDPKGPSPKRYFLGALDRCFDKTSSWKLLFSLLFLD